MDNAKEMSIFFAGREFARRGINTLALDGPGMGETRRIRDMPSRYDYEVPVTAAFDFLAKRSDVDAKRIVIFGYSFGGYYSSCVAAFEKRYAARVALLALHWDLAEWQEKIRQKNANSPTTVAQSNFQFRWVVGAETAEEGVAIAKESLSRTLQRTSHVLFSSLTARTTRVVPVENVQKFYDAAVEKQDNQDLHDRRGVARSMPTNGSVSISLLKSEDNL